MSDPPQTYRFVIDAYRPDTLPMARLAEYLGELARLFGATKHVHFVRLEPGSAVLVQHVDPVAAPNVQRRLNAASRSDASGDIAMPFNAINRHLAKDNATGSLQEAQGIVVLYFPGRNQPPALTFGPFRQSGTFDGTLIRVGGRGETVPVHLRDGDAVHVCNATREIAQRLAPHLFGDTLRVRGNGRWERNADGQWILLRFDIKDFEPLDDAPLGEVVHRLRSLEGSGWHRIDNPGTALRRLRHEPD